MGSEPRPDKRLDLKSADSEEAAKGLEDDGLEKRFPVALGLYLVLGLLVWFTMGDEKVLIRGKWVDLRLFPLIVIGGLALRTYLARQAHRIRRESGE